jgi:signal transduction histidine kinase
MRRTAVALAISCLGLAAGLFTLDVARDDPGYWFAGSSALDAAMLLVTGWALIGCGVAAWARQPDGRFGPLFAAGGFAWFLLEWNNPGIDSALAFTVGLCLSVSCPPLVAHGVLSTPSGRRLSRVETGALVAGYAAFVLGLGLLPALFYDPAASGCSQCPANLVLVADRPGLADGLTRVGLWSGLAAALLLAGVVARRLLQASTSPRRAFLGAGAVYLVLVAAFVASSLDRAALTNGASERRLWLVQAAALVGAALATAWAWARLRRARADVARLVIDLAEAPPPGGLRDVLAAIVADPSLVVAYPLEGVDRLVDAQGRPVELPPEAARTTLVENDSPVAVLAHAPGLLDDAQLVSEAGAAARLALENERLHAEIAARLEELRRSRARIVDTADAERRRLERDLHDGAQQRLVGLSLTLGLVRSRLAPGAEGAAAFDAADTELRAAVEDLRELAHGLFPSVLADEGVGAAIEALAEEAPVPVTIGGLPIGRFAPAVETAAYTVVAELARAATGAIAVRADRADGTLVVEVETPTGAEPDLVALRDRLGALEGSLTVDRRDGRERFRAEVPCAS